MVAANCVDFDFKVLSVAHSLVCFVPFIELEKAFMLA